MKSSLAETWRRGRDVDQRRGEKYDEDEERKKKEEQRIQQEGGKATVAANSIGYLPMSCLWICRSGRLAYCRLKTAPLP
jgi:hypothetical protein